MADEPASPTRGTRGHEHPGLTVHVERTGPCLARVRVTVTDEEFRRSHQAGLRNVATRTRLKGFRPGKVPPNVVEKHFGPEVEREVIQHFLQDAFEKAVSEKGLKPAASPRVDLEALQHTSGKDFEHEFEILLRPEIELGDIEGLSVETRPVTVGDEELDAALAELKRDLSRPEPAGDEGLPPDGVAVCRVEFLRQNGAEPVLVRDGIRLGPRTPLRGIDPQAFEEALTGARAGDTRTFPFAFPGDFPHPEARGEAGTCRVVLTEAWRIVPPTEEELFTRLEVADEKALRDSLRERILRTKQELENRRIESALLDQLIQAHPRELPEPLVEEQARAKVAELRSALEGQGTNASELEERLQEEHRRAREAGSRALRAIYLMEEIAKQKNLQVTAKDLDEELDAIARRNGVPREEVRKYYREKNLIQELALELLERKVRSFLRGKADIQPIRAAD